MKAKFGDKITIEIVGVDPAGIPNAVDVTFHSEGRRIYPSMLPKGAWATLHSGAFKLARQWFAEIAEPPNTVFITANGRRYHNKPRGNGRSPCGLWTRLYAVEKAHAEAQGLQPCSVCFPQNSQP